MTDEFIEPTGAAAWAALRPPCRGSTQIRRDLPVGVCPGGGIADGDVFVCFNFRADRAKEMFE